jgi:hypothetical protein
MNQVYTTSTKILFNTIVQLGEETSCGFSSDIS